MVFWGCSLYCSPEDRVAIVVNMLNKMSRMSSRSPTLHVVLVCRTVQPNSSSVRQPPQLTFCLVLKTSYWCANGVVTFCLPGA